MTTERTLPRSTGQRRTSRSAPGRVTRKPPPILVRQMRGGIEESVHRGDVVEADVDGRLIRGLGDPDRVVTLRSCVKPFGVIALIEAGGIEAFELEPAEIALMASSHSGEDLHVRTLQGMYRRAGVSQTLIATGSEGMPLDALTAARLARDGEKASPIRHMCSGQHSVFLLLSRLRGWDPDGYWLDGHPAQVAYQAAVARVFGTTPARLRTGIDGCGVATYAFPLREVARAYALLAEPSALSERDPRSSVAQALTVVRDAMLANPEMVAGTRDRLDTSLMKAAPGRLVSKGGMEALGGIAVLAGRRGSDALAAAGGPVSGNGSAADGVAGNGTTGNGAAGRVGGASPSGIAIKIEDGGGFERGRWSATVEVLAQAGVLDPQALRALARYHRPVDLDPHGRVGGEAIPDFDLAPLGELL
ncbi:MAG TPA: asparaginase [Candidatus Limnocylindrales bacterium]|nr:asparaginase [Candidatus Limnocylindrales bacterium]